ncbi:MAG: hypothetical protein QF612_00575 [Candidatus Thalassarchaeaceae archaeon]|nr:hypothetical protein [Candidatus Thalassarchaeaceae archaeon]
MGVARAFLSEKLQAEWLRTTPCVEGSTRYGEAGGNFDGGAD